MLKGKILISEIMKYKYVSLHKNVSLMSGKDKNIEIKLIN